MPCRDDPAAGSYDAVVVVVTVAHGHWERSAIRYLRAQDAHLSQRPTFLFQVVPGEADVTVPGNARLLRGAVGWPDSLEPSRR
ncbi:MAG: hypothetical protein ACR2LI_18015 [Propionibacteriaceae bacterium]